MFNRELADTIRANAREQQKKQRAIVGADPLRRLFWFGVELATWRAVRPCEPSSAADRSLNEDNEVRAVEMGYNACRALVVTPDPLVDVTPFGVERAQAIWAQRGLQHDLSRSDMTPAERAYVNQVWDTMGDRASWMSTFYEILAGRVGVAA